MEFAPHFEEVLQRMKMPMTNNISWHQSNCLHYYTSLKEYTNAFKQWEEGFTTPQQVLLRKFIQLVNNFYIEKRTIEEYAEMLHVTANYLSQSVKSASGKNALSYINDRLLDEAKSIIQFTDLDIAEIAYQLNFSDPANFGKFFKKHTNQTPLEFRKSQNKNA
jgi:AraC-like DNA-binding protein